MYSRASCDEDRFRSMELSSPAAVVSESRLFGTTPRADVHRVWAGLEVDDLESLVSGRKLRHGNHPVLTMCIANATVERDAAGNRELSKKRSSGRIDGAVALAMAIAATPPAWTAKVDIAALIG